MIRAVYDPQKMHLRIWGHAGSAPRGQDLICAGVSALALGLQESLEQLNREGCLQEKKIRIEVGEACFSCKALTGEAERVRGCFETVFWGLYALQRAFPERIWTQRGGNG